MALQDAEKRRDALMSAALQSWNKKALRMQKDREGARSELENMIGESKRRQREHEEQQRSSAPWKGALTGAASGAGMGSAFGPMGMGIGAAIGGIGGLAMGSLAPETMYEAVPYAQAAGQMGMQYAGQQSAKEAQKARLAAWERMMGQQPPGSAYSRGGGGGLGGGLGGQRLKLGDEFTSGESSFVPPWGSTGGEIDYEDKVLQSFGGGRGDMPAMRRYGTWFKSQPAGSVSDWEQAYQRRLAETK